MTNGGGRSRRRSWPGSARDVKCEIWRVFPPITPEKGVTGVREASVKKLMQAWVLLLAISGVVPLTSFAQALSGALGASDMSGLKKFSDCHNPAIGHREKLIADRLESKLAVSPALTSQERDIWAADIQALRKVDHAHAYKAPDPKNPQQYLLGLTDQEQVAINSMDTHFVQQVNLDCEHKYGGVLRYSQGADQSGQTRYENQLRSQMQTPIDISTIPVGPLPSPFPKSRAELAAERRAARRADAKRLNSCGSDATKGLRLSIMADKLQEKLDSSQGLSAKDQADFEADIKATRAAAAEGLEQVPPVDPSNPNRVLMRLSVQDQMDIATEYSKKYMAVIQGCAKH
jgi:hypothetical protein